MEEVALEVLLDVEVVLPEVKFVPTPGVCARLASITTTKMKAIKSMASKNTLLPYSLKNRFNQYSCCGERFLLLSAEPAKTFLPSNFKFVLKLKLKDLFISGKVLWLTK